MNPPPLPFEGRSDREPANTITHQLRPSLLLVVNRRALDLLAAWVCPARGDSAAFAIGGNYNSTCDRGFSTFLNGEVHGPIVHLRVGTRV